MGWITGIFRRSWLLTRIMLRVLRKDPELFVFPLLYVAIVAPFVLTARYTFVSQGMSATVYVRGSGGLFSAIVLGVLIANPLFGICIAYATKTRIEGGNAKLFGSLWFGLRRIHLALLWMVVNLAALLLVGMVRGAAKKLGPLGRLLFGPIAWLLESAWRVAKIFVYPAMAYKNVGPAGALRESVQTLRSTWGEALVRHMAFGAVFGAVTLVAALLSAALIELLPIPPVFMGTTLLFVTLAGLHQLVNTVFSTALYHYAVHGEASLGLDGDLLRRTLHTR